MCFKNSNKKIGLIFNLMMIIVSFMLCKWQRSLAIVAETEQDGVTE